MVEAAVQNSPCGHIQDNTGVKETETRTDTRIEASVGSLKTIVLWIYNINQNGSANTFHEDMSQYFTKSPDGNVLLRDMTPDVLAEFLASITTAKEIKLPDLGVRLVLLIYNCNQNGVSNAARVAYAADS